MSDPTTTETTTEFTELTNELISPLAVAYNIGADVVTDAVTNGVLALEPTALGDHGLLIPHPGDWMAEKIDTRPWEDLPRFRELAVAFTRWESLAHYVNTYGNTDSLGYVVDLNGKGPTALCDDLAIATVVLDEHPAADGGTANRKHTAALTLRPTTAAVRWATALTKIISQEQLLDLVVDGIGEIATPDGADLRDLIADLHAVRTTAARSVFRSGGETAVELADNVTLHGGVGNTLTIPETIMIVFQPWTAVGDTVQLVVKVKPIVNDNAKVAFKLTAPTLDDRLADVVGNIAGLVEAATSTTMLWVA